MKPPMEAKLTVSNGNIPFIPLHVVEEILLRLDAQTLFQCFFVCREWNELITSLNFISRRSDQTFGSRNQILLIKACHCRESVETYGREYMHFPYCRVTYSVHWDNDQFDLCQTIESPTIDDFKGMEVIGTSNGLVCLASKLPFKFILWNPTIQKYVWLPLMMITWDESPSRVIGFGFDRNNNDFKIVSIVYRYVDDTEYLDSAWVFSYVKWSWKRLTCSIPRRWMIHDRVPHVFFNDMLHWIAWHRKDDKHIYEFILTFDLTNEVFGQILFPNGASVDDRVNSIATTGDSLILIQERHVGEGSNLFSIWIMKQFGNHQSWTNIFSTTTGVDPECILGARKNGDLILDMGGGQIRRYNPTTSTNLLEEAMKNSIFFCYHTQSLYLLEKEDVNSY